MHSSKAINLNGKGEEKRGGNGQLQKILLKCIISTYPSVSTFTRWQSVDQWLQARRSEQTRDSYISCNPSYTTRQKIKVPLRQHTAVYFISQLEYVDNERIVNYETCFYRIIDIPIGANGCQFWPSQWIPDRCAQASVWGHSGHKLLHPCSVFTKSWIFPRVLFSILKTAIFIALLLGQLVSGVGTFVIGHDSPCVLQDVSDVKPGRLGVLH